MNQQIKSIKILYRAFYKVNGQYKLNPASPLAHRHPAADTCTFLGDYLDFVMNSGLLSDVTKAYITSMEDTPREIARVYNENREENEQITTKMLANHRDYDEKRLAKYFDGALIRDLLGGKGDVNICRAALNHAVQERLGKSLLNGLTSLKLPRIFCTTPPDTLDLNLFLYMIEPYTKRVIHSVEAELSPEVVGYINYLSAKTNRTEEEEKILQKVRELGKN